MNCRERRDPRTGCGCASSCLVDRAEPRTGESETGGRVEDAGATPDPRREIHTLDDLKQFKTEQAIKAAGKMRAEGKSYIVHDGDIMHFLFNV